MIKLFGRVDDAADVERLINVTSDASKLSDDAIEGLLKMSDDELKALRNKSVDEIETIIKVRSLNFENALKHIKQRDFSVPRRRGIGGAHDSSEFFKYNEEFKIINRQASSTPGVEIVDYQIYALDKSQKLSGELKSTLYTKTLYDPKIWTDPKLKQALTEALEDSFIKNSINFPSSSPTFGYTSDGYKIMYTHNGNSVTSFWFD